MQHTFGYETFVTLFANYSPSFNSYELSTNFDRVNALSLAGWLLPGTYNWHWSAVCKQENTKRKDVLSSHCSSEARV
jgi:hypothetical protein